MITDAEVYKYFRSSIGASTSVYTNLIMSFTFQNEDASGTLFSLHDWTENSNNGIGRNVSAVDYSNQLYTTIAHNECIELDGNDDYLESVDSLAFENAVTNYLTLSAGYISVQDHCQLLFPLLYLPLIGIFYCILTVMGKSKLQSRIHFILQAHRGSSS